VIGRVFRGADAYGLVKYLFEEGRRNEHVNPRLVGSWDGFPAAHEPAVGAHGKARVATLAATLKAPLAGCPGAPDKYVYHLMLRNHDTDRVLTDAEWAEVAARAMARVGIAPQGEPGGCRWVAVRHDDNHIHVAATLAREDGGTPNLWRDFVKLREFCRETEQRLGLTGTAPADKTATPRAGVREQVTAERGGRAEPVRDSLRRTVGAAAAGSAGYEEFLARLGVERVQVRPRYSERQPGQVTGLSFALQGHTDAAGAPIWFGGGTLAPDLSWPKLRARWEARPAGPGPAPDARDAAAGLTDADRQRMWDEAERVVREAAERIRADAEGDPDAAADAAWAGSDAMSALAGTVEGPGGGPLSEAADALSRAGREVGRRTPARTDTGAGLRLAARTVAAVAVRTSGPDARARALVLALAAFAAAVADLRVSQQGGHQAAAARLSAEQLRAVAPPARRDPTRPATRGRGPADPRAPLLAVRRHRAGPTPTQPGPGSGQDGPGLDR